MATQTVQGLKFFGTEQDGNGHDVATYFMYLENRPVLRVLVDQTATVPAKQVGGPYVNAPEGMQVARITIRRVDQDFDLIEPATETEGYTPVIEHNDGTGTHADGAVIQAYVYPRLPMLLADLYIPKA